MGVKLSLDQLSAWKTNNPSLKVAAGQRPAATKVVQHPAPSTVAELLYEPLVFDVVPMGAPRMTQSDKFNKRPVVLRYRANKDLIREQSKDFGYDLGPILRIRFEVPMTASWSKKKKDEMRGQPHQQKPDIDNMVKLWMDAFHIDDSHVHTITATKVWADTGRIIVYP